jgi:hypothetical protein
MTRPTLHLVAPAGYFKRIGCVVLAGHMRIVDASDRDMPADGVAQWGETIYCGADVYAAFATSNKC